MKKRFLIRAFIIALLIPVLSVMASADASPKPSVVLNFKGLERECYYATLLSETESTGPWSKGSEYRESSGDRNIWEKFNAFQDRDGFSFLGYYRDCTGTDVFEWTYYPPGTFKILLYFPEYDRFIVSSGSYERYAFDSYYTVDATDLDILSVTVAGEEMRVLRTYDFTWEIISLLCRILVTISVELGLAWLFGFRAKKQILVIGLTNITTQTALNILLNIVNYNQGQFAFIFHYVWMEAAVFGIEGFVYRRRLHRYDARPERGIHPWLYAFVSNLLSFAVGMLIAKLVPGIF